MLQNNFNPIGSSDVSENDVDNKKQDERISRVRNIIESDMLSFHNLEFTQYIESYKKYIGDVTERLQHIEKWQANTSHSLVFMMVDTIFGTIFDFDYQMELKTKNIEKACTDAYDFQNKSKRAIGMAAKEALITGTGIVRDYTFYEKGEYEAFGNKIDYEIKNPSMEYISVFNIMYDRMRGLNESTYKTIRHFLTKKELLNKIKSVTPKTIWEENKQSISKKLDSLKLKENNMSFSYYNYEAIKGLLFSNCFRRKVIENIKSSAKTKNKVKYDLNVTNAKTPNDLNPNKNGCISPEEIKNSVFSNNFNEKYEVIEFKENGRKYFFVNGEFILEFETNNHIYNMSAFHYNEVPGSGKSIGIGFILKNIVEASNAMLNMFFDSIILGNKIVFSGGSISTEKGSKVQLDNGTVLKGNLSRVNLGGNDFSGMNAVQILQDMGQSTIGVNQMVMGGDSRVQRIAGAFDFNFSQYKARLTPFTDSIDMAMSKILKGRICQYISLYSKEELEDLYDISVEEVREGNNKNSKVIDYIIDNVSMKEILNENNISFKFDSMFNMKKDMMKKTAMEVFQLSQQYGNSDIDITNLLKLLAGDKDVDLKDILSFMDKEDTPSQFNEGYSGTEEDIDIGNDILNQIDNFSGEEIQQEQELNNLSSKPVSKQDTTSTTESDLGEPIEDILI